MNITDSIHKGKTIKIINCIHPHLIGVKTTIVAEYKNDLGINYCLNIKDPLYSLANLWVMESDLEFL